MNGESLRNFCLSLPHVAEDVKWGNDLCFLIGQRIFAVTLLEPDGQHFASFKCTPERFAELIEIEGIIPAPYMARNHWVMLQRADALRDSEMKKLVRESYQLAWARLPKRMQRELSEAGSHNKTKLAKPSARRAAR